MKGAATGFWSALRELRDNPLAVREWRGLAHQARDWRLWVGLRIPRDARGWGVPAIAWFFLAPYVVWGSLTAGRRVAPAYFTFAPTPGVPEIDILALCFALLAIYPGVVAAALMASAVSRERENETWDTLRSTVASPHDILLGLLAGRLGPVLLCYGVVGLVWVLARPHYAPLMASFVPFSWSGPRLAGVVGVSLALALAVGVVSIAASVRMRRSGTATVLSASAVLLLGAPAVAAIVMLPHPAGMTAPLLLAAPVAWAGYVVALRGL